MAGLRNLFNDGEEDLARAEISLRYGEIEEIIDAVERAFQQFENFRIVQNPPFDHYFIFKKPNKLGSSKSTLIEKIKREWELLRLHLARSSIYVRAYEKRPDLMRAMMLGPEGTPYCHGLYCFDILFPSSYPTRPPEVFYRSYGQCLNPNLNGKVNIAALSGVKGFFNFKMGFNPTPVSILEVLTTIQNSFFVEKTNETQHIEVLKQTSEAMLCTLMSPPQNFEVFVHGHFRTRAHQILMNYKFHIVLDETMTRLFFKLIRAFESNGTYCQHHYNKDSYDRALQEEMLH